MTAKEKSISKDVFIYLKNYEDNPIITTCILKKSTQEDVSIFLIQTCAILYLVCNAWNTSVYKPWMVTLMYRGESISKQIGFNHSSFQFMCKNVQTQGNALSILLHRLGWKDLISKLYPNCTKLL